MAKAKARHGHAAATKPNSLEAERQRLIKRNHDAMEAMGLMQSAQLLQPKPKPRTSREPAKNPVAARPTRQSSRLRSKAAEVTPLRSDWRNRPAILPRRPMTAEQDADYEANLYRHNVHRLVTMSYTALRTRITKIRNIQKMRSFVAILEEEKGMEELAEEARQALQVLLANLT